MSELEDLYSVRVRGPLQYQSNRTFTVSELEDLYSIRVRGPLQCTHSLYNQLSLSIKVDMLLLKPYLYDSV